MAGVINQATAYQTATYRKLTESVVVKLYQDKAIARTEADTLLQGIGFGKDAATFVLTVADLTVSLKATDAAVNRVGTLYRTHKITAQTATSALTALGVVGNQSAQLLQTWTLERHVTVKTLTEAQIVDAWYYGIMTVAQALATLESIGYTAYDAYVILSVKNKSPLPTMAPPARTAGVTTG